MVDLNKSLAITIKTGKVLFGIKDALRSVKVGKAKLIIVASNCPQKYRQNLEYYCKLSRIPLIFYSSTSVDLGIACGKPFQVSALTIREPGDSDILKITVAKDG